jgi:3-oxoacyl-[acyl-carrier protein] reductase
MNPAGRVAVISGGSSGIGAAVVDKFTREGLTVAVLDPFDPQYPIDVRDEPAVRGALADVVARHTRLDVVVACAGGGSGSLGENCASTLDSAVLRDSLELNLFGAVHLCTAASPYLPRHGGAAIVTVGSINGIESTTDGSYAHYGTAKAALAGYTRYLAQDLAPAGVRVNHLAAGPVATERMTAKYAQAGADQAAGIPLGRAAIPAEIADTVFFLTAPSVAFLTGTTVAVHGGLIRAI